MVICGHRASYESSAPKRNSLGLEPSIVRKEFEQAAWTADYFFTSWKQVAQQDGFELSVRVAGQNSKPSVAVMQPAEDRHRDDDSNRLGAP